MVREQLFDHGDADRRARFGQMLGDLFEGQVGPADLLPHRVARGAILESSQEVLLQLGDDVPTELSPTPRFADPIIEPVRELIEVLLTLANRLGIAAQEGGNISDAAMAELRGLDGRIAPAILLRERIVEHSHRVLDLGAVRHERSSVSRSGSSLPQLYDLDGISGSY